MASKIQLRRDTAANWLAENPVLAQGEVGVVTDTGDVKVGDGSSVWAALAPFTLGVVDSSKLVSIGDLGYGTSQSIMAVSTAGTSEMMFTVGVAATNVTAMWEHWYTQSATNPKTDADPAGSISFSASLRVVSSSNPGTVVGTIYRLTFNGRTTATLDPGGRITADILGLSLRPGDVVAIRTYLISGTAYAPRFVFATTAGWGGFVASTDLTAPGSASVASSNGYCYGPAALLGYGEETTSAKSVLLLGDSIAAAVTDAARFTRPELGVGGFVQRALTGKAGVLSLAFSGDLANYFQSTNGSFRRLSNAGQCNSAIIEYGTNDIVQAFTAAEIQGVILNIAANLRRLGISKVFVTTLAPRTTSTDGWATTTNQTPLSTESVRVEYNNWVRAKCPVDPATRVPVAVGTAGALLVGSFGHPVTGVFDTGAKVESALNSGFWLPANRVVTDASMTSGATTVSSPSANFTSTAHESGGDLGAGVMVIGAGPSGANLFGNIGIVPSSTSILVDAVAGTTVTNANLNIGVLTLDGVHPSAHGYHLMSQAINAALL